ncbi:MAG: crosslink repair DNA glycosylase YcaQ family protein, partial [Eubacteriales bacterium]|nr:crosslink repair DNA glycosylase YcaQ family protein [Eubacteriales bacterium]
IISVQDWKYFARTRRRYDAHSRSRDAVEQAADPIKRIIGEKGSVCARDLGMQQQVDWYWSPSTLARVALETLYFRGELIIHHKAGGQKYYGLAGDHLPAEVLLAPDPNATNEEYLCWQALRRVGSVGLLWCRPSAAFLGVDGFTAAQRQKTFCTLLEQKKLLEVAVDGVKYPLYCRADDEALLQEALRGEDAPPRMEFLAPLDNLLWDRDLIRELFDFDYKWEVYTPVKQRKYGHYVLPILYGDSFVGRVEARCDRRENVLRVVNLWGEQPSVFRGGPGEALADCMERFAAFHGYSHVAFR